VDAGLILCFIGHLPGRTTAVFNTFSITVLQWTCSLQITRKFFTVTITQLFSSGTGLEIGCWILPESHYIASARPAQKNPFYCWNVFTESLHSNGHAADRIETSHVIPSQRTHWCTACCPATNNKHSYFYCCMRFNVFTESLPSNALAMHIALFL
jgi:hypothetical protein